MAAGGNSGRRVHESSGGQLLQGCGLRRPPRQVMGRHWPRPLATRASARALEAAARQQAEAASVDQVHGFARGPGHGAEQVRLSHGSFSGTSSSAGEEDCRQLSRREPLGGQPHAEVARALVAVLAPAPAFRDDQVEEGVQLQGGAARSSRAAVQTLRHCLQVWSGAIKPFPSRAGCLPTADSPARPARPPGPGCDW